MGDTFKKVKDGEKLVIPARTYNAMVDAAQDYANRRNASEQDSAGSLPPNIVYVKNSTAATVERLCVLGISDTLIAASYNNFKQVVAFSGVAPSTSSHSSGRFVVTLEAIKANSIGRAIVAGICQVKVNVTDTAHCFADVKNGDSTQLNSAESGPAVILYKESGTGTKWAVIRFGGSGGGGSTQEFVTIVETLSYPSPESPEATDAYRGRWWYNCRLVGQNPATAWAAGQRYYGLEDIPNRSYVSLNNIDFRCLAGHYPSASDNAPDPSKASNAYWEKVESIRIDKAYGFENPVRDLRNCVPWFNVGEVVPVVVRDGIYYFSAGVAYTGEPDSTSLRWLTSPSRVAAVFA